MIDAFGLHVLRRCLRVVFDGVVRCVQAVTKKQTQQEVVTRLGNVIAPIKKTKGSKSTKRRPLR